MLVLKAFLLVFALFVVGTVVGYYYADYRWRKGRCGLCGCKGDNCECM